MKDLNGYIHYVFAAAGLGLSVIHPLAGLGVVSVSLGYGVAISGIDSKKSSDSKSLVDALASVVNVNAAKLEAVVLEQQQLQSAFQLTSQQRALGMR